MDSEFHFQFTISLEVAQLLVAEYYIWESYIVDMYTIPFMEQLVVSGSAVLSWNNAEFKWHE